MKTPLHPRPQTTFGWDDIVRGLRKQGFPGGPYAIIARLIIGEKRFTRPELDKLLTDANLPPPQVLGLVMDIAGERQ